MILSLTEDAGLKKFMEPAMTIARFTKMIIYW